MADNDDKRDDQGAKKTLTLKSGPSTGLRPGMGRSSRTVVVEKRTRRVGPPGAPAAFSHTPAAGNPTPRPASPQNSGSPRTQMRSSPQGRPSGGLTQGENVARERALREAAARQ